MKLQRAAVIVGTYDCVTFASGLALLAYTDDRMPVPCSRCGSLNTGFAVVRLYREVGFYDQRTAAREA